MALAAASHSPLARLDAAVRLYSLPSAARLAGCSVRTLYRHADAGALRITHRILEQPRIAHAELVRYVHGRDPLPEEPAGGLDPDAEPDLWAIDAAARCYSPEAVGRLIEWSRATVYRLIHAAELESFTDPRDRIRVSHEQLADYLERCQVPA